jgi:predicted enzyme related to lactoylglutathione lyase
MASALGSAKVVAFAATLDRVRAKTFYGEVLGLTLTHEDRVTPVPAMTPASYTVLGWQVSEITAPVKELTEKGVVFERYAGLVQDELGIWTAPGGAQVAWFKDPDGNLLSLSRH